MALFKILRGAKANLASTKIKDGYAYFTPEDGKFYIDVSEIDGIDPIIGNSKTEGANRICINNGGFMEGLILDCGTASSWTQIVMTYFECGDSNLSNEADALFYDSGDSNLTDEQ